MTWVPGRLWQPRSTATAGSPHPHLTVTLIIEAEARATQTTIANSHPETTGQRAGISGGTVCITALTGRVRGFTVCCRAMRPGGSALCLR